MINVNERRAIVFLITLAIIAILAVIMLGFSGADKPNSNSVIVNSDTGPEMQRVVKEALK